MMKLIQLILSQRLWFVVTGLIFVIASLLKASDPHSFAPVAAFLGIKNHDLLVAIVIGFEMLLGTLLLFGILKKYAQFLAIFTLVGYSIFLVGLLFVENPPDCNCLGKWVAFQDARFSNIIGIIRNSLLILWGLAIMIVNRPSRPPTGIEYATTPQYSSRLFAG